MDQVFSFLQRSAELYPKRTFIVDKGNEFTYAQIYRRVVTCAEELSRSGLNQGDRIFLYLDNSVEYIIAFFAVMLVNCIAVPINKNLTIDVIDYIASETDPKLIITNSIYVKRLQGAEARFGGSRMIDIDRIDETKPWPGLDITAELSNDGSLPALILYTSGTTRMPKGVTLTHKNLTANTESIVQYLGLTENDSVLAVINFCYSYGNSVMLTHTKAGGTLIIENRSAYPLKVVQQLYDSKATGFSIVGSYLNTLLKQEALKSVQLEHLRYMTFAGESTSFSDLAKLKEMAPHLKIYVMYGQTEASARLSYLEPDMLFQKAGSVGKGIPGVALRVVAEDGHDAPVGEIGEIIASGDNIMKGYWNNAEETETAIRNGWLYTGDLAVTDEDGYIYIKGRKDDIIKHLGHRISPVEIEAAINGCDQVLESAVIGIRGDSGVVIKAFVKPKNTCAGMEEIIAQVKKQLPSFKRPQLYEFIKEIPRTANGKIKRSALQKCE
jgi:long-chain acyl-CoA synthetase